MRNFIVNSDQPSNDIKLWLNSQGSLTALLEKKAGQPLKVKVVFEGYRLLNLKQKKQLNIYGLSLNKPVIGWFREVLLYGNTIEPWVFAQSIFPIYSLKGNAKRLKNLNKTPIGYVLFKRQKQVENTRLICKVGNTWKRQSLYRWKGRNIMISETFLDSFNMNLLNKNL